jgi:hypothetical protein
VVDVAPNKFTPSFLREKYPQMRKYDLIVNRFDNQTYYWENEHYHKYSIGLYSHSIGSSPAFFPLCYYYNFPHNIRGQFLLSSYLINKIREMNPKTCTIKWGNKKVHIKISKNPNLKKCHGGYSSINGIPTIFVSL